MADKLKFTSVTIAADTPAEQSILVNDDTAMSYVRNIKVVTDQAGVGLTLRGNGLLQGTATPAAPWVPVESKDTLLIGPGESLTAAFEQSYADWETEVLCQNGADAIHECGTRRAIADGTTYVHPIGQGARQANNSAWNVSYQQIVKPQEIGGRRCLFKRYSTTLIQRLDVTEATPGTVDIATVTPSEAFSSLYAFCFNHDGTTAWTMHTGQVFKRWLISDGGLTWTRDTAWGDQSGYQGSAGDTGSYDVEYIQDAAGQGWLIYFLGSSTYSDMQSIRRVRADDFGSEGNLSGSTTYAPYYRNSVARFTRLVNADGSSAVVYQIANSGYSNHSYVILAGCSESAAQPTVRKSMYMHQSYSYSVNNTDKQWVAGQQLQGQHVAILDHARQVVAVSMGPPSQDVARYWLLFEGFDRGKYIGALDAGNRPSNNVFLYSGFPSQDGALGASVGVVPTATIHVESVEVSE